MSSISEYRKGKNVPRSLFREDILEDFINYGETIKMHPWIVSEDCDCIISPDCDGFLCGLLVSNLLNWNIAGFYDGKALVFENKIDFNDCVFLDCEINRIGVKSIGNHLLEYNRGVALENCHFENCINPNLLRGFDGKNSFQRKYPFGTIHLLLALLQYGKKLCPGTLKPQSIGLILFADGVGNNLFGYPENCLDWIRYLGIREKSHVLNSFLCNNNFNFYTILNKLEEFFHIRDQYNAHGFYDGSRFVEGGRNKRSGHQLKITNSKGEIINIVDNGSFFDIHTNEVSRVKGFIKQLSSITDWSYQETKWRCCEGLILKQLKKDMLSSDRKKVNNKNYAELFQKNPFSLAMTASNRIEFSIE